MKQKTNLPSQRDPSTSLKIEWEEWKKQFPSFSLRDLRHDHSLGSVIQGVRNDSKQSPILIRIFKQWDTWMERLDGAKTELEFIRESSPFKILTPAEQEPLPKIKPGQAYYVLELESDSVKDQLRHSSTTLENWVQLVRNHDGVGWPPKDLPPEGYEFDGFILTGLVETTSYGRIYTAHPKEEKELKLFLRCSSKAGYVNFESFHNERTFLLEEKVVPFFNLKYPGKIPPLGMTPSGIPYYVVQLSKTCQQAVFEAWMDRIQTMEDIDPRMTIDGFTHYVCLRTTRMGYLYSARKTKDNQYYFIRYPRVFQPSQSKEFMRVDADLNSNCFMQEIKEMKALPKYSDQIKDSVAEAPKVPYYTIPLDLRLISGEAHHPVYLVEMQRELFRKEICSDHRSDDYEILDKVAETAMNVVYKAQYTKCNPPLVAAVKVPKFYQSASFYDEYSGRAWQLLAEAEEAYEHYKANKKAGVGPASGSSNGASDPSSEAQNSIPEVVRSSAERQEEFKKIGRQFTLFKRTSQFLRNTCRADVEHFIDSGKTYSGLPYLATQWIEGKTLREFLQGSLSRVMVEQAKHKEHCKSIFLQIVRKVRDLHVASIYHRDLKPSNIMIRPGYRDRDSGKEGETEIFLIDFGLVKQIGDRTVTQINSFGTPEYCPPQDIPTRFPSTSPDFDAYRDMFSLAMILVEVLTGEYPGKAGTYSIIYNTQTRRVHRTMEVEEEHQRHPFTAKEALGILKKELPLDRRFDRLIEHSLRPPISKHPLTVAEFYDWAVSCWETPERHRNLPVLSPKEISRRRFIQGLSGASVVLAMGVGGYQIWDRKRRTERARQKLDLERHKDSLHEMIPKQLAEGSEEAWHKQRIRAKELACELDVITLMSGILLRFIPSGTFWMGSGKNEPHSMYNSYRGRGYHFKNEGQPLADDQGGPGVGQEHGGPFQVQLSRSLYVGKYPVTEREWVEVMGGTTQNPDYPKTGISWVQSESFLKRLCDLEDVPHGTYRFLTEAEWEYACRAGTRTMLYNGNMNIHPTTGESTELDQIGWYISNSRGGVQPVGMKKANGYGLYDMIGNVNEWCSDYYDLYPRVIAGEVVKDPLGPNEGSIHVFRGGSWNLDAVFCRSARRDSSLPGTAYSNLGLRVVRIIY